MNLKEIIQNSSNISVNIQLQDLRQFLDEVAEDKLSQIERANQAKKSDGYFTAADACKMLKVSRSSLTRWAKSGYLVPIKLGGASRYAKTDIERILNSK